ncbi:hypothetical protein [Ruminococcus flavefaciens]|uniref:hypothetical protein n=1 Tax=Ruminococcus flavefaciens TaxID=1265 RepID=UPI0004BB0BE8|nr:hypothetical protein [Ruminococcus flavefaciens]
MKGFSAQHCRFLLLRQWLTVCTQPFSAFAENEDEPKCPSGITVSKTYKQSEKN